MSRVLAEGIVAAIVLVWLVSVLAAVLDPSRADVAVTLAPIMGTIAGAAVAALALTRRNGKNGGKA